MSAEESDSAAVVAAWLREALADAVDSDSSPEARLAAVAWARELLDEADVGGNVRAGQS